MERKRTADQNDKIGLRQILMTDFRCLASRDPDAVGIIMEQTTGWKARCQWSTNFRRQGPTGGLGLSVNSTHARNNNDLLSLVGNACCCLHVNRM